jgi:hypothetical protein
MQQRYSREPTRSISTSSDYPGSREWRKLSLFLAGWALAERATMGLDRGRIGSQQLTRRAFRELQHYRTKQGARLVGVWLRGKTVLASIGIVTLQKPHGQNRK